MTLTQEGWEGISWPRCAFGDPRGHEVALVLGHARQIAERHVLRNDRLLIDRLRAGDDLGRGVEYDPVRRLGVARLHWRGRVARLTPQDRKSTRLNSSHVS